VSAQGKDSNTHRIPLVAQNRNSYPTLMLITGARGEGNSVPLYTFTRGLGGVKNALHTGLHSYVIYLQSRCMGIV